MQPEALLPISYTQVMFLEKNVAQYKDKKYIELLMVSPKKKKKKKGEEDSDDEEIKKTNSFYKTRPCIAFDMGGCQKGQPSFCQPSSIRSAATAQAVEIGSFLFGTPLPLSLYTNCIG